MRKKRPSEYVGAPPYEIGKKWGDKEWKEHYEAQRTPHAGEDYRFHWKNEDAAQLTNYFKIKNEENVMRKCPDCGGKFASTSDRFGDKCRKCLQEDEDDMSDAYEARWEDGSGENR